VSEKSQDNDNDNDNDNEEYNNYVKSNGIWQKLDAKANAFVRDWFNTWARKKIRQHGGLLTTQKALRLVMKEDKQEMIDDIAKELREHGHHLLADAFRDESTRPDAMRVLQSMLREMESPD
jgi:hypothetical protein